MGEIYLRGPIMGEAFCVSVKVGGELPANLLPAFLDASRADGLGLDWSQSVITDETALMAAIEAGEPLELNDPECNYGMVDAFLAWCRDHGLAYRYQCDPRYEWDGELRQWQPDWEIERAHTCNSNGDAHVTLGELSAAAARGRTLEQVIESLTLPELPAFTVAGTVNLWVDVAVPDEFSEVPL